MAVIDHAAARGPRAASRRAFRFAAALPREPVGVEVLAAVKHARQQRDRVHEWDARIETSCIAMLTYLWRRGRGEKWAGCHGSARYGCSIAQLTIGVAEIMGWDDIPRMSTDKNVGAGVRRRRYEQQRARFVKKHRKSVQRWLDWLQDAGLVSHTPQQDEEGFWWRTIIELHPVPAQLPAELVAEAVDRRAGWRARERRRDARGRHRNLTGILRRARLSRAQRRARSVARRRELAEHAERQRVRALAAQSLADAAKTHVTHPFGASTTSRGLTASDSQDETFNRGLTGARALISAITSVAEGQTAGGGEGEAGLARVGEELRWAVYHEVKAARFARTDEEWEPFLHAPRRRVAELLEWPAGRPVERWRLIECWAVAAHGERMSAAGGFRLAFWSEDNPHHGPRLERALARYARYAAVRPSGWPVSPVAAFAGFLAAHTPRQEGPEHGMAYDVARFNELTKQMSAYAHVTGEGYLERAARRAARRRRLDELADDLNSRLRFRFRLPKTGPDALLRRASELLDSDYQPHQQAGRVLYATAKREERLAERDQRLQAGKHPGDSDGRYRAAYAYAQRWGLPAPPARWEGGPVG